MASSQWRGAHEEEPIHRRADGWRECARRVDRFRDFGALRLEVEAKLRGGSKSDERVKPQVAIRARHGAEGHRDGGERVRAADWPPTRPGGSQPRGAAGS